MQTDEFIERVHLRVPEGKAETTREATRVTLHALGGILSEEEAHNLAAQLPSDLADAVTITAEQPGPADCDELYELVATRADIPPPLAASYAAAVVDVLRKAVSGGEFTNVVMDLPAEFDELVVL